MRAFMIGLLFCLILFPVPATSQELPEECTVGVASGSATADGRPLLWKNRDADAPNNEVAYFEDGRFKYIAITTAGHSQHIWAGANEMGFCIINSASRDLEGHSKSGMDNGEIMKKALQTCVTARNFEQLLIRTNTQGRQTNANFGVIDAFGGAVFFETGNYSYTRFDANDRNIAPYGYIVRSNFAETGGGSGGRTRFLRGDMLWKKAVQRNELSVEFLLREVARDLADESGAPYSIPLREKIGENPAGTILTETTINRWSTVSAVVCHGVLTRENPSLTTFWAVLGEPILSVAVPCWVIAQKTAGSLDNEPNSPLCSGVNDIKKRVYYDFGEKSRFLKTELLADIWETTYPAEDSIFHETETLLAQWRANYPTEVEVAGFHQRMAQRAFSAIQRVRQSLQEKIKPIRVGVYADFGADQKCVSETIAALSLDPEMEIRTLSGVDIANAALDNLDAVVFPGGSGSRQAGSLGDIGRKNVREFVAHGGGYVGICAGAYLGSDHPDYDWRLGLADAHVIDREHYERGKSLVNIELTPAGSRLLKEYNPGTIVRCYYANGPLLSPGQNPQLADYAALAHFQSDVHLTNDAPPGKMPGSTFLLEASYGTGKAVLCAGHPESTPGARWIVPRMVRSAAARATFDYASLWVKPDRFSDEILFTGDWVKQETSLLRKLISPDTAEKLAAMKALTEMGSRDFFQWLPGRLRDDDPEIRKAAAGLILELDYIPAVPDLEAAANRETDEAVKKAMVGALDQMHRALPNTP
ncbi:MAG: BPL-N domain-containing protein [Candidatus Zhuqueibacterota bacterium]